MNLIINGKRYLFQWQYTDDEAKTAEFLTANRPVLSKLRAYSGRIPLKASRFTGMTICRIKTPGPDGKLIDAAWQGYAFRRRDEKTFSKATGRRYSLQDALLSSGFNANEREAVWIAFNKQWPPVRPEATMWEKRYKREAMENIALRAQLAEYMHKVKELVTRFNA